MGRARAVPAGKEARRRALEVQQRAAAAARSFGDALAQALAGSWNTMLHDACADVAAKRDVVAEVIERVEPVRVGYGTYAVNITRWTATGDTSRAMAGAAIAAGAGSRSP